MRRVQKTTGKAGNTSGQGRKAPRRIPALDSLQVDNYWKIQHIIASSARITVVCGAGISTRAGIPDFRSKDGLYHQRLGGRGGIDGAELFSLRTLSDPVKLKVFNRTMTEMRIKARQTTITSCHSLISALFDAGRLLRCYTQNIDGLQTRDRSDMVEVVLEMHGSNSELVCLKCHERPPGRAADFDNVFLDNGFAVCPRCEEQCDKAERENKRRRQPGILLPGILFNEQSAEIVRNGKSLEEMLADDSSSDLLLVVGTSLHTNGIAKLVKSLAKGVHVAGGAVLYINRDPLLANMWGAFVDVHIQTDIEDWSRDLLSRSLQEVERGGGGGRRVQAIGVEKTVYRLDSNMDRSQGTTDTSSRTKNQGALALAKLERPRDDGETCDESSPTETIRSIPEVPTRIFLVVYHDGWAIVDARALAAQMADACMRLGWDFRQHIAELQALEEFKLDLSGWDSFCIIAAYVSHGVQSILEPDYDSGYDCNTGTAIAARVLPAGL
ncbi:DHS-like NAD/FAD-binding domain-containing protein [Ceratobasidium sp. AG-I]|nr:DHS-like NAD/FAD-binding domain-containing protein [Ceratobasidium sp. AG-I]